MPGPYHGVMIAKDQHGNVLELINQARTAAYLSNPDLTLDGISICDILEFGGCENYKMMPTCDPPGWEPLTFDTPTADPAPWYNADYPESADALGFYIEEWTGLDDRHVVRSVTQSGGYGGRAHLGPITAEGRVQKLNILLFGRNERAVEYLFRWLGSTLMGVCGGCATDSILFRRHCGSTLDPTDGLGEQRRVGLTEGLGWEAEPTGIAMCTIRRASFTITAGDPCIYLPGSEVAADLSDYDADLPACLGAIHISPTRSICRPSCTELTSDCRTSRTFSASPLGAMAPIVTWENPNAELTYPFRALVYADPLEIGTTPNPCGLEVLGELYVRPLPGFSALIWDVVGRDVQFMDATTGVPVSGWAFIEPNDPPLQRFFALRCSKAHLVMEPATGCAEFLSGTAFEVQDIVFNPPRFPDVNIMMQERVSCP